MAATLILDDSRNHFLISSLTFIMALTILSGCAKQDSAPAQLTFPSPEDAVVAAVDALKVNDTAQIIRILGPDGNKILSSGDEVADRQARELFLTAYYEKAQLSSEGDRAILSVGAEEWPMPIPLVKDGSNWRFDTAAGLQEVLFRRIGRNELNAIQTMLAFVDAENEYADMNPTGGRVVSYAQRIISTSGTKDGLYWPTSANEPRSPLGAAMALATIQGYRPSGEQPTPYHGYYYKTT